MIYRLLALFILLFSVNFLFFSCDSNEYEKVMISSENIPIQTSPTYYLINLENSVIKDSLNINLRIKLASKYYSEKNFDKALFHFLKVIEIDNKNLNALIYLGNIYYDIKQFSNAIEFYSKAIIIDKNNINVRCDMATCYLNNKLPEKAIEILNENIILNYNHAQSHYNLSVIYRQLGKTKEADEELQIFNKLNIK